MVGQVLLGVVAPALVCAALVFPAMRPWRRGAPPQRGWWGALAGVTAGVVLAFRGAWQRWPELPPHDVTEWLPPVALVAAAIGMFRPSARAPRLVQWAMRVALAGAAAWILCRPIYEGVSRFAWAAAFAAAIAAAWLSLDSVARRSRGTPVPIALFLTAAGGSVLSMVQAHISVLALIAGGVAAMILVLCVVAGLNGSLAAADGAVAVLAPVMGYVWVEGHLYGFPGLPISSVLLLLAAPSAAWLAEAKPLRSRPVGRVVASTAGAAAVVGAALAHLWLTADG